MSWRFRGDQLTRSAIQRSFWDAHNTILGFILSLGLCVSFTDFVKVS